MRLYNATTCTPVVSARSSWPSHANVHAQHGSIPKVVDSKLHGNATLARPKVLLNDKCNANVAICPSSPPLLKTSSTASTSMCTYDKTEENPNGRLIRANVSFTSENDAEFDSVPGLRDLELMLQRSLSLEGDGVFDIENQVPSDASTLTATSSISGSSIDESPSLDINDFTIECSNSTAPAHPSYITFDEELAVDRHSARPTEPTIAHTTTPHKHELVNDGVGGESKEVDHYRRTPTSPFVPIAVMSTYSKPSVPPKPAHFDFRAVRARLRMAARKNAPNVKPPGATTNKKTSLLQSHVMKARNKYHSDLNLQSVKATEMAPKGPASPNIDTIETSEKPFLASTVDHIAASQPSRSLIESLESLRSGIVHDCTHFVINGASSDESNTRQLEEQRRLNDICSAKTCDELSAACLPKEVGGAFPKIAETTLHAPRTPQDILEGTPTLAKYNKMMKMGLPIGAIKNAMIRDGLDPSLLDGESISTHPKIVQTTLHAPRTPQDILEGTPTLAKYNKMMKMGLPIGAIKNAMIRDGINPSLLDGESGTAIHTPNEGKVVVLPRDKFRRTRVHWEAHNGFNAKSVWALVKDDLDIGAIRINDEEFGILFRSELGPVYSPIAPKAADQGVVKIIDAKRANNGGIILARVKLSYNEIAEAVDTFDQDAMTSEQIRGLIRFIPTPEERKALKAYMSNSNPSVSSLCECEKFMIAMLNVQHAKRKLQALLFMQGLSSSIEEIRKDTRVVQRACDEIVCSLQFRKTLGIILDLGNRLNTAGYSTKERAKAITISSLLKLNQAKAFDQKTNFLHFVVKTIRSNNASLLQFRSEIPTVFKAEKSQWDQSIAEMEKLETELNEVRKLALHQSGPPQPFIGDEIQTLANSSLPLAMEVEVLQGSSVGRFTLDACLRMAVLVNEVDESKEHFTRLLRYFGEENSSMRPDEVFKTLSTFSRSFDVALDEVLVHEKPKLKEMRLVANRSMEICRTFSSEEGAKKAKAPPVGLPTVSTLSDINTKTAIQLKRHKGRDV